MSTEGLVEAVVVWAIAAWVVAIGMLVAWAVMKRRDR